MAMRVLLLLGLAWCSVQVTGQQSDDCRSGWKLIFRAVSGNGQKVYTAWNTIKSPKNCTVENGCLSDDVDLSMVKTQNGHLASPLIGQWSKLGIKKVKLELFRKGHVVVDMIFNGTGTRNSEEWFSRNRLLENSFDDLFSDGCLRYFSMKGNYGKKFLIAQESYLCNKDYYYWMAVVDYKYSGSSSRFCDWEKHNAYPVFLYAPKHHKARFYNGYGEADMLAVYIKTDKDI